MKRKNVVRQLFTFFVVLTLSLSIATPVLAARYIGVSKAKNIALNHAAVSSSTAKFIKAKLDCEDGIRVYEIEFYSDNKEYDYEINASTGAIVSYDYDAESYTPPATPAPTSITVEQAKSIAFGHASVSSSTVRNLKAKLDRENGQSVYAVEFKVGRMEYEYVISASNGNILEWDSEYDD